MTLQSVGSGLLKSQRFSGIQHTLLPFRAEDTQAHDAVAQQIVDTFHREVGKNKVYAVILPESKGVAWATYDRYDQTTRDIVFDAQGAMIAFHALESGGLVTGSAKINQVNDFPVTSRKEFKAAKAYIDRRNQELFPTHFGAPSEAAQTSSENSTSTNDASTTAKPRRWRFGLGWLFKRWG